MRTPTSLDAEVLAGLKIEVISLRTAVDKLGCCYSLMTTSKKYRLSNMKKMLTQYLYNACAMGGPKINGDNGLEIFVDSKETADDFEIFLGLINKIHDGDTSLGTPVMGWRAKKAVQASSIFLHLPLHDPSTTVPVFHPSITSPHHNFVSECQPCVRVSAVCQSVSRVSEC
jgi:hypothetical protein